MKIITLLTFAFLIPMLSGAAGITKKEIIPILKPTNIIYGINEDKLIRIPPPAEALEKSANSTQAANIKVTYHDFSPEAQSAFEYAVNIWSKLINTSQTIYVNAYWKKLGRNTLGSCSASSIIRGYDGLPENGMYYVIPLAEKLTKSDLNEDGEADINANFSSESNWYYGKDGKTPSGKYDLVTVILHELCHGFGFTSSFNVEGTLGSYGWGTDTPISYDQFLKDVSGKQLIDTVNYKNHSAELRKVLLGNILYFDGPVLKAENGKSVLLFAPGDWDPGSSISHLNKTYSSGDNGLMTPSVNTQMSIHNPGLIARAILDEQGWKNIHIEHEPLINTEEIADITIKAKFLPDFETTVKSPSLSYSIDSTDYIKVEMKPTSVKDEYAATVEVNKSLHFSYYITANDKYERKFKLPVFSPDLNYAVYIGADTIGPSIKHYPNTFLLPGQDSLEIVANVSDDFGIDTVLFAYAVNEMEWDTLGFSFAEKDQYRMHLDMTSLDMKIGDSIRYQLIAIDKSKARNRSLFPDSSLVTVVLEEIPEYIPEFVSAFEGINRDFILQGFRVSTPNGFTNGALHTKNPYEFAGDNSELNYIAQLRYPIMIDELYHYIEFDEIVLVEPGEPKTVYGDDQFWDYVIVEASLDNGNSWIEIEDGWDSRWSKNWESTYNNSVYNQYAQAIGSPEMYEKHLINLLATDKLKAGDKVLIRFRLYSDPFAYGWGWAIDNLKIQSQGVSSPYLYAKSKFRVYPNPVSDNQLFIESGSEKVLTFVLYNSLGIKVYQLDDISGKSISLPYVLKGNYILKAVTEKGTFVQKLMIQ